MCGWTFRAFAVPWALLLGLGCSALIPGIRGSVEGRLQLVHAEGTLRDLGPWVVYLEGAEGGGREAPPVVRADEAGLRPAFVAVGPAATLRLESEDLRHHELFAIAEEGRLEAALPPGGRSELRLPDARGVLRFYCRLHDDERLSVFVAPSGRFARPGADGRYRLGGVPPGRYTLAVWSDQVSGPVRPIRVRAGRTVREDIWLDGRRLRRP